MITAAVVEGVAAALGLGDRARSAGGSLLGTVEAQDGDGSFIGAAAGQQLDASLMGGGVDLRVLGFNCDCMNADTMIHLEQLAVNQHIVCGVEVGRDEWELEGFDCFPGLVNSRRSETGAGRGQGLAVWVKKSISSYAALAVRTDHYVFVRLDVPGCRPMFIGCVYFAPASSSAEWGGSQERWQAAWEQLQVDLHMLMAVGEVCVLGDFNAHTCSGDDRGMSAQQVFDDLGVPGPGVSVAGPAPVQP